MRTRTWPRYSFRPTKGMVTLFGCSGCQGPWLLLLQPGLRVLPPAAWASRARDRASWEPSVMLGMAVEGLLAPCLCVAILHSPFSVPLPTARWERLPALPRGGQCRVSFLGPWCHLPASASLQAAGRAIVQTANLLRWNDLRQLAEKGETWRIAECLVGRTLQPQANGDSSASWRESAIPVLLCFLQLRRDQSRAEEYLQESQPYLQDPQAALREEAVRFIGEPQPLSPSLGSVWWSQTLPCGPRSPLSGSQGPGALLRPHLATLTGGEQCGSAAGSGI